VLRDDGGDHVVGHDVRVGEEGDAAARAEDEHQARVPANRLLGPALRAVQARPGQVQELDNLLVV
jgi:hypothetical protein